MVKGAPSPTELMRLKRLEVFVERVIEVAETFEIIADAWGGDKGKALAAYARRLGEMAREVRDAPVAD